jgi:hypothetical protein
MVVHVGPLDHGKKVGADYKPKLTELAARGRRPSPHSHGWQSIIVRHFLGHFVYDGKRVFPRQTELGRDMRPSQESENVYNLLV